jgi:hypothetical protein
MDCIAHSCTWSASITLQFISYCSCVLSLIHSLNPHCV